MDINNLERLLEKERKIKNICAELNNFVDMKSTLFTVLDNIKELSRCHAVGIRIHDNGDYPYYVYSGFPESFIISENSLCLKDYNDNRIPSPDGEGCLLDCMCGNIIRGRFDSSLPFFTENGSFWSNNTTALLASTSDEERQSRTRNYCNSCGYESVALIPIKIKSENIGLIQLNDMRIGMFTEDLIEYFEMIGKQIGQAVKSGLTFSKLQDEVTKRKRAEEEIKSYTSQLEAANNELEAFSYSVSHDLRAPLRAIDGFSRIMLEDYSDKLDTEGKRQLNIIRSNTEKMAQLIDDLLNFSSSGRHEIRLSKINIQKLAEEVFKELKAANPERKLQLKIKKQPNSQGDRSLIREVYVNLLDNAVKFTRPRENAIIEVGGRVDGNECIYYVKDNGVGFDMKYEDKLFGVFQRLHSMEEFEGTGVGLAIIQRIIHRHGGRVWAEGKLHKGATFYFTLPSAE